MRKQIFCLSVSVVAVGVIIFAVSSAFAAFNNNNPVQNQPLGNPAGMQGNSQKPSITGTVSSVNGSIITVKMGDTSYSVDASSATVKKFATSTDNSKPTETTISVSDIQSGDTVMIQGKISGTSVVATEIVVGMFPGAPMNSTTTNKNQGRLPANPATSTPKNNRVQNRSSAITGTVSAISGTTITITDRQDASTTYAVDASNANVTQGVASENAQTLSVSDIKVGDVIEVTGAISISATSIIKRGNVSTSTEPRNMKQESGNNQPQSNGGEEANAKQFSGFWSKIGNFFGRIFSK